MDKNFYMNYAEGQNSPTVKYGTLSTATQEAQRLADKLGVKVSTLQVIKEADPKDITARVKSYEDACAVLKINAVPDYELLRYFSVDEAAYFKLKVIARALNEGWKPDWSNGNEYKYWPWFVWNNEAAGFAYALTADAATSAHTTLGSRLCYKTRDLAAYAGKQFKELYNNFLK